MNKIARTYCLIAFLSIGLQAYAATQMDAISWPSSRYLAQVNMGAQHGGDDRKMLKMNKQQMDVAAEESLLLNMTEFLSYNISHFERDIPKKDRDIMIKHSIKVARSYGFRTERDIAVFITHMMTINPGFHNQPRIHVILTNPVLPIKERLHHLVVDANEQDWEQASKMVNAAAYWARVLQAADKN